MNLVGLQIVQARPMTKQELDKEGWTVRGGQPPICLILSDGTKLYPSRDSEGNGPGVMFGTDSAGTAFSI